MDKQRRPILHKGEVYNVPVERTMGGPTNEPTISYSNARDKLLKYFSDMSEQVASIPKENRLPNEIVVCYRMESGYTAKSYYPKSLLKTSVREPKNIRIEEIGSRLWRANKKDDNPKKLFFVRTNEAGLNYLTHKLGTAEDKLPNNFKLDVRRIKNVSLLNPEERILGFPDDWKSGVIELVLHPFLKDADNLTKHFNKILKKIGIDFSTISSKIYEDGMTFISFTCNKKALDKLAEYNPLRSVHPLKVRMLPDLRSAPTSNDSPKNPKYIKTPEVKMGIFDGGLAVTGNNYFEGFSENIDLVPSTKDALGEKHGTAVTGAALYGPLNKYKKTDILPHPDVYIKHYRVLPKSDAKDSNLYEIIDAIEKIIPENKDIKIYNLSLGPSGPIIDDQISRFTYAIDRLQSLHDVIFCTAVGNDGEHNPFGRIQSPSDSVNGIGVGAHTLIDGAIKEIEYSCYGPGREGNKHKPDVSAYGGCERNKIHLIDTTSGNRLLDAGTSYASPIVSSLLAQIIGYSNGSIDTLTGRALLIHKSNGSKKGNRPEHHKRLGHGYIPEAREDVVNCEPNSYTLIYRGEVPAGKYVQLRIPWLSDLVKKGKITFKWTLAINTTVNPHSPDSYTTSSLETIFYPNAYKYRFKKNKTLKTLDIQDNVAEVEHLISNGWLKSNFPVSDGGIVPYSDEYFLRSEELKWDTIDYRNRTKMATGVKEPMFHLHALTRGGKKHNVKYAMVLTVIAPEAEIDIYSKILQNYDALVPVKLTLDSDVPISIKT